MDFFTDYGIFLAKTATFVIAILIIMGVIATFKEKAKSKGKLSIQKLNEKFDEMAELVNKSIQTKKGMKLLKQQKKSAKKEKQSKAKEKREEVPKQRLFVIHFNGDLKASAVAALREEVTAILLTANSGDQVLCCLESPGGLVNAYGFAASQLHRLKEADKNIKLIVAVDKVAASGGYLMACVADEIIAAPFAVVGSIGVVLQLPNFHRFLEKKHIDFEQLTAGEFKRTLTVFGKNTHKGRNKMQQDIEETHALFKSFVAQHRPRLNIDKVATGEHWYGSQALQLNLIDAIKTSDDHILSAKENFEIYEIKYHLKKSFGKRFSESVYDWMGKLWLTHSSNH